MTSEQGTIEIKGAQPTEQKQQKTVESRIKETERNIAVFGVGDGGSNIGSMAQTRCGIPSFIYNLSPRGLINQTHTKAVILENTDGSGQDIKYAVSKYDSQGFEPVCELLAKQGKDLDYLFPVATGGGGTGAGTLESMSNDIHENFKKLFTVIPVCILPSHQEEGNNFFNALKVLEGIAKSNLPYFVYDNNFFVKKGITSSTVIYDRVNAEVIKLFTLFSGKVFTHTRAESIIDSKDFRTIVNHKGRMNYFYSDETITARESLDQYIMRMIENSPQPSPSNATCYGLFIKGPKEIIERLNTSIPEVRAAFGFSGQSFFHSEIGDTFAVGLLTSGSSVHEGTVMDLRALYQDSLRAKSRSVNNDLFGGIDEPIAESSEDATKEVPSSFKRARK